MYYKVVNQESEVYKKLRALREDEIRMDNENLELIKKNIPCDYDYCYSISQQTFERTKDYAAFQFLHPSKVDLKIWKTYKDNELCYEPNRKTKEGRRISDLLRRGMQTSDFRSVHKALDLKSIYGQFTLPYLDIFDDIILVFVDDKYTVTDKDVIEITRSEFHNIVAEYNAKQKEAAQ